MLMQQVETWYSSVCTNKYFLTRQSLTQVSANHETSIGKVHHKLHTHAINRANSCTDKYKQWLTPPDTSTNLNNALKNHLFDTGSWLLNKASSKGHKQIVELLLAWGADINLHCQGFYGSALIAASTTGHTAIAKILLLQGADVNHQCNKSHFIPTALIGAASQGKRDIVEMLLQRGADVNIQGETTGNALYAAAERHYTEIVQLLLAHGAKYLGPIDDTFFLRDDESDDSDSMYSDSDSMTENIDSED